MILQYSIVQATTIPFFSLGGVGVWVGGGGGKLYKNIRAGVQPLARKHTCDVDMRRAYAIGVLDSIEDTLKVHMYWLNVQGLRVKAFDGVECLRQAAPCCNPSPEGHLPSHRQTTWPCQRRFAVQANSCCHHCGDMAAGSSHGGGLLAASQRGRLSSQR